MSGATTPRDGSGRFAARLLAAVEAAASPLELAPQAAAAALRTLGDGCAIWLWDRKRAELRLAAAHHREPAKSVPFGQLMRGWFTPRHNETWHQVAELCHPAVWSTKDEQAAEALFGTRRLASLARRAGVKSVVVVPMLHTRRRVGIFMVASAREEAFSDRAQISEIVEMARHLSTALAVSQRLEAARQTGQQLTLVSLRLQTILENMPQGVVVTGTPDGKVAYTNESLVRLLGGSAHPKSRASSRSQPIELITPAGETYAAEDVPWVRSARTGVPTPAEEMLVQRADGSRIPVLCSASPVRDEQGNSAGSVAILHDISERKEFERHKDEFLAMVAHELRTPLTALKGYIQLVSRLLEKDWEPQSRARVLEMLQVSDQQIGRLTRMIHDLLDFSRIRSGRLDLLPMTFSLGELASSVAGQMQMAAPSRLFETRTSGDTLVYADTDRIEQVLMNLLSNAVNATQCGGRIEILVRREGEEVIASVCDDGMGIPPESQKHLFEQLYRGSESRHKGMGLGLFISKGIVDAHGGRIWFESDLGKGTSFHFALPAASCHTPVAGLPRPEESRNEATVVGPPRPLATSDSGEEPEPSDG